MHICYGEGRGWVPPAGGYKTLKHDALKCCFETLSLVNFDMKSVMMMMMI